MPKAPCASLAWLAFFLLPGPASAADLVVDARSGYLIQAAINGRPVRLRVDPETSGYIILNPEAAARIGLRPSLIGARTRVGPVRLDGSSRVARVAIGGVAGRRRLVWLNAPGVAFAGADGLIGPADLHYDRVIFEIGPSRPGEAAFVLPMAFARRPGLFYPLRLGERTVNVQFSLIQRDSLATAAAGAHLAATLGGGWSGAARDQIVKYGVVRPVRPLALARPAELGGFRFARLLVRTGDNRGDLSLPPEPDADPEEILVTGASRQQAMWALTLGLDRLSSCSRMIWDNRARRMTLHCSNP